MAALYFLVCYPVLVMIGLLRNKHRVDEKKFNRAFNQLWSGINTNSSQALLYESIFCIRRFYIVLINVTLSPTALLNDFEQHQYLAKIFVFLLVQAAYILYVYDTMPHTSNRYNKLEFFNEGLLMLLAYLMIAYCGIMATGDSVRLAYFGSLAIVMLVTGANLYVLARLTFDKIALKIK